MQIKTFAIPAFDIDNETEVLNKFLRSHKVLEVITQLVIGDIPTWHYCVKYLETTPLEGTQTIGRASKDYRDILPPERFQHFDRLRKARKRIAQEEAMLPYMIFTNEELYQIVSLDEISISKITTMKGVGAKKKEFAERLLAYDKELETVSIPSAEETPF